jgi:hypothetical protein
MVIEHGFIGRIDLLGDQIPVLEREPVAPARGYSRLQRRLRVPFMLHCLWCVKQIALLSVGKRRI